MPSLAAQLRAFLVLLPCTHKWLQRKRSLQAWYRLRLWGLLVRFSRFVSSCCLQQLTNRRGQGRGDCSFQSQTPLTAAPLRGLPARYLCGCRHRSAVPTSTSKYPSGGNQSRFGCSAWICFVPRTNAVPIKTATQSSGRLTPPAAHNLVNVCVIFEYPFIC